MQLSELLGSHIEEEKQLSTEQRIDKLERDVLTLQACIERLCKEDKFEMLWRKTMAQDIQTLFNSYNKLQEQVGEQPCQM